MRHHEIRREGCIDEMDGPPARSGVMTTVILACILFVLSSAACPQTAAKEPSTRVPIARSFMGLTLGDSIEDVGQEYTLEHAGVGGLRSGEEARKAVPTPQEADRVIVRFLDGKLYEIAVYYTRGYSSDLGWEEFISAAARTYGLPHDEAGDSVTWTDEQTSLLLGKNEHYKSYGGFGSMVTYFSAVYSDRAMAHEASQRKMAIAPDF